MSDARAQADGRDGRFTLGTGALCALAGFLAAMVIGVHAAPPRIVEAQGGSVNGLSGMASAAGEVAVLTCDGGSEDILLVLDQRAEEVLVYRPQGQQALEFRGRYRLAELMADARLARGAGVVPARAPAPAPAAPSANPVR
jgi:hypothetical protein